jgi:hypothetical protein
MLYNLHMPSLLIKDMPPELHQRLREAAERDHRSMNRQAIVILEAALNTEPSREPEIPPPIKPAFPMTSEWLEWALAEGRM